MAHYSGSDPDHTTMAEAFAIFGRLLLFLAVIYALLAVAAHYYSLSAVFPRPPLAYELTPDYVQLTAPDGVKLAARHWPNPAAKYTLLYLHGNYQDLGSVGEYMPQFVAAGYAVFALDYRHYGHSGGTPNEANLNSDVSLAYDYLHNHLGVPADRIIVYGFSLGAGPGVELALRRPVAGLVMQGAFVSVYRVLTRVPLFPGDKFTNITKVAQLRCPVLVIHGTVDETVPFWHGEKLFAAITARKEKLFVEDGRHNGLSDHAGAAYWSALRKFADSL